MKCHRPHAALSQSRPSPPISPQSLRTCPCSSCRPLAVSPSRSCTAARPLGSCRSARSHRCPRTSLILGAKHMESGGDDAAGPQAAPALATRTPVPSCSEKSYRGFRSPLGHCRHLVPQRSPWEADTPTLCPSPGHVHLRFLRMGPTERICSWASWAKVLADRRCWGQFWAGTGGTSITLSPCPGPL